MTWRPNEIDKYVKLTALKIELAEALSWPYLENLSWFQTWPGGWCLHGRAGALKPQDAQTSMNFELPPAIHAPDHAIKAAIRKVHENPERLIEKVRWYCEEHGWEEILPRGQMSGGCPTCGFFACQVIKPEGEE